ncbi:septum formation initiator family protein [Corynebacterium diphtheriae]
MVFKKRRAVPVVNREEKPRGLKLSRPSMKVDGRWLVIYGTIVIVLCVAILRPLNTYMDQKAETARLKASIAEKQIEKERLLAELEKYDSEAYVKEQARKRLGVIAPGEKAYRVMTPELENQGSHVSTKEETKAKNPWYEKLWDSVTIVEPAEEAEQQSDQPQMNLPLIPADPPSEQP